ncbi:MAG: DUF465 domain-containing protein [Pseudomonadota bacterium]
MSLSAHLAELQKKHQVLAQRIEEEERSPAADHVGITDLKRRKLLLKDEIKRLSMAV